MVSYEQALAIARGLKSSIDACDEHTDAFSFKVEAGGRDIGQTEYFDHSLAEHIREFPVP